MNFTNIEENIKKVDEAEDHSILTKLLTNVIVLMIFWWALYIISDYINTPGAGFVAVMCGLLSLAWVIYNLGFRVNKLNEKEKAINRILTDRAFLEFKASKLIESNGKEDAKYEDF
jgi:multisubunit Na+/H+ antiporter MnhB subunit